MDLKDFIKETISQIAEAIVDLNNSQNEIPLIVNPTSSDGNNMITKAGCSYKQTTLHYNIALNVTDEGSSGGKIGVLGGFFGGLSENAAKNQSGALTSLDFQLDVLLPQG